MTNDEINLKVAKEVMGWKLGKVSACDGGPYLDERGFVHRWEDDYGPTVTDFQPSTKIEDAMQVVERLRRKYSNFGLGAANGWGASFWRIDSKGESHDTASGNADTPEMAICLAALDAVAKKVRLK